MKAFAATITVFFIMAALLSGQPIEKAAHDFGMFDSCFDKGC